jgi:hypothetical protein
VEFNNNSVIQYSPDSSAIWSVQIYGGEYLVIGWAVVKVQVDETHFGDEDEDEEPNTEIRPVVWLPGGVAPIEIDGEDAKLIRNGDRG